MTGRARANGEGSIFPYRNGYAAYAWVRTPAGLRKKKWVYGKTREHVHEKWTDLQQKARQRPIATKLPTVGEHSMYWLDNIVKPNSAPLTHATHETYIRRYVLPHLGAKKLDRLSVRDVQLWINKIAAECQCCVQGKDAVRDEQKRRCCAIGQCCGQRLSARTLSNIRGTLRSILAHAQSEELLARNVSTGIKMPKIRKPKHRAWSGEEARLFLESARADNDPLYPAYVLILVLGLRKGEVLGMTWDDIDLDAARLTVGWQLQRVRGHLYHREVKTEGSEATIYMPSICTTALKLRQATQREAKKVAGNAWQDERRLVFTTRYGTPIEPRNLNRSWTARCQKAGVRTITVHDGRRSCGTLLADLDVHPRIAMQILRHARFSLTMEIYTLATSKQTCEALRRLGDSLDG